jgi:hypothetical protein
MAAGEIHLNDVGTAFRATFKNQAGVVIDISSATTIEFLFLKPDKNLSVQTGTLFTDGKDGKAQYVSVSGFLDQKGIWKVQGYVAWGGSHWYSDIERFRVYGNN